MTIFYTGKGDRGKSEMGAKKIAKDDPVFEVLGSLDELNSWIGLCYVTCGNNKKLHVTRYTLHCIQEDLFIAQAEIGLTAMGRKNIKYQISNIKTRELEKQIAKIDKIVPQIKKFIIPGGSELSAKLDFARALARRAERDAIKANTLKPNTCSPELLQYLNRLSSLLFALARLVTHRLKKKEENPSYR